MIYWGKVHLFGDNVLCDHMIAGKHLSRSGTMAGLIPYLMQEIDPGFAGRYEAGDILVAGSNFGCGSTREHAVLVMKEAGVRCIVARSFARNFYRNGVNQGIAMVEADWRDIASGDTISVDLVKGVIVTSGGNSFPLRPLPPIMDRILQSGGLIGYYNEMVRCGGRWDVNGQYNV